MLDYGCGSAFQYAQGNGLRSSHELGKALVTPVQVRLRHLFSESGGGRTNLFRFNDRRPVQLHPDVRPRLFRR